MATKLDLEGSEVVIAENPIEALWIRVKEATEQRIKVTEEALIVERATLDMAKEKLKEYQNE